VSTSAPYVGLDYFLEEDAGLFFGRDAERKRIIGNLRASRLTLLYAESGVGKSSLLRAGVSARLRQLAAQRVAGGAAGRGPARYVPVVFNAWQGDAKADLIAALEAAVRPLLRESEELALPRESLEDALETVVAGVNATPLIILDQFEESFLYEAEDDEFDDELARCINRRDLRANFLISVREDAYPLIGPRFKSRIPNVYGNFLHLDFLDERAARDAVLEPVNAFNKRLAANSPRFEIEPALVDAVLEQVRRGRVTIGDGNAPELDAAGPARVETAYLQLVMRRLWDEEIAAGSQRLRLETLRRLGGADTIVHGHLDDVMAELPVDQRDAAAEAFRFLVTSGGRKIALSSAELREFSDAAAAPLEPAIEHLERERILRPIPSSDPGGVARHEIYHDVLAPAILDWRRRHAEEQTRRGLVQARERARRLEKRNRRLAAAVIALAAVSVVLALYLWDPGPMQRLELSTVDARFSVRGAGAPDPRLVLVTVDDRTLARFDPEGTGRLPRRSYAAMLDRLRADGPAAIGLDVNFRGAGNPEGDSALLAAISAASDRVVLPFDDFVIVPRPPNRKAVRANLFGEPGAVEKLGAQAGFAGLPDDSDGVIRRADYDYTVVRYRRKEDARDPSSKVIAAEVHVPTFAFAVAVIARSGPLERPLAGDTLADRLDGLPRTPRRALEGQSENTTWIDFRGPPGTVRRVSALDVLDGRVSPGAFAGKVVVIGVIAPGHPNSKQALDRAPLDAGRGISQPELQANAIDTLLRGSPLRDVSRLVDFLAILVLACVPAVVSLSRSRALNVIAVVGTAAAFVVVAQLAFQAGWIVAVVAPLAALVAAALGVAGLAAARTIRGGRRRPSSSMTS
jgi:CHASE2 domain-containing sensor protein